MPPLPWTRRSRWCPMIRRCCRSVRRQRSCCRISLAQMNWPRARRRWARAWDRCAGGTGPPASRCGWSRAMPRVPRPRRRPWRCAGWRGRRAGEARGGAGGNPDVSARRPATPPGAVCGDHGALMNLSRSMDALVDAGPDAAGVPHEAALARDSRQALSADGPLAEVLPGFRPRQAQQDLAAAVAAAFDGGEVLLAEAGTGTGKTFAYLVPALLSGRKTIVSTGTRALQDQLYHRDLPRVRDALGTGLRTSLLKGRANYLCRHRLERARGENRFQSPAQAEHFQRIVAWGGRTRMGDLAELESLPEDSPLLPLVSSTADNCLGSDCPFWGECFVVQARQRAQEADVVVVNHHLLLADLALKQEGFGEILPGAEAFVVDEAHQLPELAAQFFGEGLSARPLVELARDAIAECREVPGALAALQAPSAALEQATRLLRAAMEVLPARGTRPQLLAVPEVAESLASLDAALLALADALAPLADAAPGLEACLLRARDHRGRLARWRDLDGGADADVAEDAGCDDDATAATPAVGDDDVRWYELSPRGFRLQRTPLDVSGPLREHRQRSRAAWVFTSATLAVEDRFDHL